MPTIKRTVSIPAGESRTPFSGSQYEFLPFMALLEFIIVADADDVEASIFTGSDVLLEPSTVDQKAATEPITWPEDVIVQDVVGGGERIGLQLRNNGVGAAVVRAAVRITPAG